jgi:hypothetical protein
VRGVRAWASAIRRIREVFQGAAQPVKFGDHELVAFARDEEGLV